MSGKEVEKPLKAKIDIKRCDGAPGCQARKICPQEAIMPEKEMSLV